MKTNFNFLKPGELVDNDLKLILVSKDQAQPEKNYVPAYHFEMRNTETEEKIGNIDFRVGFNENIKYGGNIGYRVEEKFRGHHFASRSVRLLLPFAKQNGLNEVWITCDPDNTPSRKTCELAGGELMEIVDLPEHNEMYTKGDRQRCRYRFGL